MRPLRRKPPEAGSLAYRVLQLAFVGVVTAAVVFSGCTKKSPSRSKVRAISAEVAGSAQQITGRKSGITIRPGIRAASSGTSARVAADDIYISLSDASQADKLKRALNAIAARHKLSVRETGTSGVDRFDFLSNGIRTQTIHLIIPLAGRSHPAKPSLQFRGELAIIIDDLGHDLPSADSILALPFPVTASVLPNLPFSNEVAEEAYRRGDQVMLHLPMESQSEGSAAEATVAEPVELHVGMSASQVASTVNAMLESVPHAAGVNNHQGSRATADPALMQDLMPVLREHGLFFIDSRTTAATVAYNTAEGSGLRAASRKVFLDDTVTREAVLSQLGLAARDAERDGSAIAIGHPHPATIAALSEGVPQLEARGIRLVFASDLAH